MKKLTILALISLAFVGFAFAQPAAPVTSANGSLALDATVNQYVALTITPVTGTDGNNFTLLSSGVSAHKVADALMVSNYKKWIVQVYSENGSKLVRNTAGDPVGATLTANIPYTFAFVQTTGTHTWPTTYVSLPSAYPTTAGDGYYSQVGKTLIAGELVDMKIAITSQAATEFWDAGSYLDTVHVQIAVN